MKKILIIAVSFIFVLISTIFIFNNRRLRINAQKIDAYLSYFDYFEKIVIAVDVSEYPSLNFFLEHSVFSRAFEHEKSLKNLENMYKSDSSFVFILSSKQLDELRKKFPRMSLIEIKEELLFLPNKKFYISKNKCGCD